MSYVLLNTLGKTSENILKKGYNNTLFREHPSLIYKSCIAAYSKNGDPKDVKNAFKVVKSKTRARGKQNLLGMECAPNWEILSPRNNRFFLPNSVGPAWQGASTVITLDAPLGSLIDFDGKGTAESAMLKFSVNVCPSLIKKSLYELFPTTEVTANEKLAIITLSFKGDVELGARKFVLAAREVTARLHLHGYWADFINPFSGKPFYAWAYNQNLYQIDERFRGLNMKLIEKNYCVIITSNDDEHHFSGMIYSNSPANYLTVKALLHTPIRH